MALLTSCWLYDIPLILSALLLGLYLFFKHKHRYWAKHGISLPWPAAFPYGHFQGVSRTKTMSMIAVDIYNRGKDEVVGAYLLAGPVLIVRDLEVVKHVLVKDFSSFHDRGFEVDTEKEPLGGHLFLLKGQHWRNLRIKLTPTFTTGKMRMMFPTMIDVGKYLVKVFDQTTDQPEVEVKDILARYTTDVIATCAFGLEANSLENPDTEFRKLGKEFAKPDLRRILTNLLIFLFPKIVKYFPLKIIPQRIEDFFLGVVRDTIKYREDNNVQRNDFLQLLIQLKNVGYVKDADNPNDHEEHPENIQKFSVEEAAAQSFLFYFAGFETSSSTMQFTLYELALNPELQRAAQEEVDRCKAKHDSTITYDALQEMELLDRIVSETLRKYPVASVIMRENENAYKIPNTDITIPPQTKVWMPIYAYHHDEKYYPNPEKFDPDRFLPEVQKSRPPLSYIPFGDGPRSCIGNRFGLMQTKAGLAITLANFTISPSKRTLIPMVFDPTNDLLSPKGEMYLKISRRDQ